MAQRLYLTAGRMILSRPGQDASPALDDAHKIIDSEWGYAGLLIASGETQDPGTPWEVLFPDVGYKPTVTLMFRRWNFIDATEADAVVQPYPFRDYGGNRTYNIQVMNDRISFTRNPGTQYPYNANPTEGRIIYHVFGFA